MRLCIGTNPFAHQVHGVVIRLPPIFTMLVLTWITFQKVWDMLLPTIPDIIRLISETIEMVESIAIGFEILDKSAN